MKEGHNVKNWKKRYFVLSAGKLVYFVELYKGQPTNEKGRVNLQEYIVIKGFTGKNGTSIMLSHKTDARKDYLLEAGDGNERSQWEGAIKAHIQYAAFMQKTRQKSIHEFETI